MNIRSMRRPAVIGLAAAAVLGVGVTGTAVAHSMITGADVVNNSLSGADIANNTITYADIANDSVRGTEIADGAVELKDLSASAISALQANQVVVSNWGNILRNTIGAGSAALRNGPTTADFGVDVAPPMGTGSLELQTADGNSKADFGDEVDYAGKLVRALGSPSFYVYAGGDGGQTTTNLPNIQIELNPAKNGKTYTSLVFTPTTAVATNTWTKLDASDGYWYFTGSFGSSTNCDQNHTCTLAEAKAELGDGATLYSVGVGKGRDSEFHGAVDALTIGNTVYDFEARGVIAHDAS
jgi:hypothetical protein